MNLTMYYTDSPMRRKERNNENNTWQDILRRFANIQSQINFLAGGEEVDILINRINTAIDNAINTTASTQQVLDDISAALAQLTTALNNANSATARANEAADDANVLNVALSTLKPQLEQLQTDLSDIVAAENARVIAENSRVQSESSRVTAEQTRTDNEAARVAAEQIRIANNEQLETLLANLESVDYDPEVEYDFPALVSDDGQTFIVLQPVLGMKPVDDKVHYRLAAAKGRDGVNGTGAVSTVNNVGPDNNGNVALSTENIGAASATELEATNNNLTQLTTKVNEHMEQSGNCVYASISTTQSIPSGVGVNTQVYHDILNAIKPQDYATLDNGRIKLKKGLYLLIASASFNQEATGMRYLLVAGSGVSTLPPADNFTYMLTSSIIPVENDDTLIDVIVKQSSGNALDLRSAQTRVYRLGDV